MPFVEKEIGLMTEEEIDSFQIGDIVSISYPLEGKELTGIIVDRDGFCTFYVNFGEDGKNYPISFCSHKVKLIKFHKEL